MSLKLPNLILLEDHWWNWNNYLSAIYKAFKIDFVDSKPNDIEWKRIWLKKHPVIKNMEATFWHFISEWTTEEERTPDIRRCERIKWSRPIIDNYDCNDVKFWKNTRWKSTRICLCYWDWEYLVILDERENYVLPWTAYFVEKQHTKKKLEKEYNNWHKQNSPNQN